MTQEAYKFRTNAFVGGKKSTVQVHVSKTAAIAHAKNVAQKKFMETGKRTTVLVTPTQLGYPVGLAVAEKEGAAAWVKV